MAEPYTMPSGPQLHSSTSSGPTSTGEGKKRPWHSRLPFTSPPLQESVDTLTQHESGVAANTSNAKDARWWKIRLFRGMANDVRRRAPYYWSDWKDAWDYRVVPATVYMYFAKYALPNRLLEVFPPLKSLLRFPEARNASLLARRTLLRPCFCPRNPIQSAFTHLSLPSTAY